MKIAAPVVHTCGADALGGSSYYLPTAIRVFTNNYSTATVWNTSNVRTKMCENYAANIFFTTTNNVKDNNTRELPLHEHYNVFASLAF